MISVSTAAFSPDKTKLLVAFSNSPAKATGAQGIPSRLRLWDVASGRLLRTIDAHVGWAFRVAFLPDGRRFVSAAADGEVKLWDLGSGKVIRTFGTPEDLMCMALSPNGTRVLTGSRAGKLRVWDVYDGRLLRTFDGAGMVTPIVFLFDGTRVLAGYNNFGKGDLKLWNLSTGELLRTFGGPEDAPQARADSVTLSPDGTRVFVQRRTTLKDNITLKVWDFAAGELAWSLGVSQYSNSVFGGFAFSPDGKFVLADHKPLHRGGKPYLMLREVQSGKEVRRFEERKGGTDFALGGGQAFFVSFSPDGGRVTTADGDAMVRVWDVATGKVVRSWPVDLREGIPVFSADGKLAFVSGGANQSLSLDLWDVAGGKRLWYGRLWELAGPESTMP